MPTAGATNDPPEGGAADGGQFIAIARLSACLVSKLNQERQTCDQRGRALVDNHSQTVNGSQAWLTMSRATGGGPSEMVPDLRVSSSDGPPCSQIILTASVRYGYGGLLAAGPDRERPQNHPDTWFIAGAVGARGLYRRIGDDPATRTGSTVRVSL